MNEFVAAGFVTLVWGLATAAAVVMSVYQGSRWATTVVGRILVIGVLLGFIAIANLAGLFFAVAFGYCEHCAGADTVSIERLLASGVPMVLPSLFISLCLFFIITQYGQESSTLEVNERPEELDASTLSPPSNAPIGICPNCDRQIFMDAATCYFCNADFSSEAAWHPLPKRQIEPDV